MAIGLDDFAGFLTDAKESMGQFRAVPYYEPETDSLIFYARNVSSYGKRVSRYLTIFLSNDDNTLVGVEVKGFKRVILPAVEGMGDVSVGDCLLEHDGKTIELSVIARCALASELSEQFRGECFDQMNSATKGVSVSKEQLCGK
jgi:hypothetical protein